MPAQALERLVRHSKRSRVVWHPGSTPPYSSLWMTVQRFLILNQPTRAAFIEDFGVRRPSQSTKWLEAHQASGLPCPIRLVRFARVLGEPLDSFRHCHISQFSRDVGRYFGDFAVCPQCLSEGFHSVLYSFSGLRECPVHHTEFWRREGDKAIPSPRLFNELFRPFVRYGWEKHVLEYSTTRAPKANGQRNRALGEVADWLMDIGLRYWIGTPGAGGRDIPLRDFTEHVFQLKMAMSLPCAAPSWLDANDGFPLAPATLEIAHFGTMKVSAKCLHDNGEQGTIRYNTDLSLYYKTLLCDFKAIHRYLKRQIPVKARHWLTRLGGAVEAPDIGELLQMGGPNALTAWALVLWWRQARSHGFDSKVGLACRPYWRAHDPAIPAWVGKAQSHPSPSLGPDLAHLWLVRWISAAGLLRFWRSVDDEVARQGQHPTSAREIRISAESLEARWSLGISTANVLTLCISNDRPDALVHAGTLL